MAEVKILSNVNKEENPGSPLEEIIFRNKTI